MAMYRAWLKEHRRNLVLDGAMADIRAHQARTKLQCDRCGKFVPAWFIQRTAALPPPSFGQKVDYFVRHERMTRSNAGVAAQVAPDPVQFGCFVCSGRDKLYPLADETESQFTERRAIVAPAGQP